MKCEYCREKSVIHVRHTDKWFCEEHLVESVEKKVMKTIKKTRMLGGKDFILVAASGGKDSTSALHVLNKNFKKVEALFINEGVEGYRDVAQERLKKFCGEEGVKLNVFSFEEEFGQPLDEIVKKVKGKNSCAVCGVLRRYLINKKAVELRADKLVTGHNLDDTVQDIIMNLFQFNMELLAGLKSVSAPTEGFVQRTKPFRRVSERESMAYALIKGFPIQDKGCPYSTSSFRRLVQEELNRIEFEYPKSKLNLQMIFDRVVPRLERKVKKNRLRKCEECGQPTNRKVCEACRILEKIK